MKTRQELKQNPELLKDKCRGAIIGIAIGDSFGDASRKPDNQLSYGITTDFHKGASWSTDDTEFALLTAKTILECKGQLTDEHVVKAWLENVATQDEFKRGGASEFEASRNLRRGLRPPVPVFGGTFFLCAMIPKKAGECQYRGKRRYLGGFGWKNLREPGALELDSP